jgi:aldose 1-epimerase
MNRRPRSGMLLRHAGIAIACALAALYPPCSTAGVQPKRLLVEFSKSTELFGGVPALTMRRHRTGDGTKPEFLSVTMLPGRGMDVLQITADLPGRCETALLDSPSIEEATRDFGGPNDQFGNQAFYMGSAFLIPFANRMLGDLPTADGPVTVKWGKTTLHLSPNSVTTDGRHYAIHGMLSNEAAAAVSQHVTEDGGTVEASFHCGDFHGRWPSQTDIIIRISLTGDQALLSASTRNVGNESQPMGVGTHPYFRILGGNRAQVRVHVPGATRMLVNNYTDVFPTGKVESVAGTPYDPRAPNGVALGNLAFDDQWGDLTRDSSGAATAVLIDPKVHFGVQISALSPQMRAIQVYSPLNKNFVAIEDQFHRNDPFGPEWNGRPTGMEELAPGESVAWKQSIRLIIPH